MAHIVMLVTNPFRPDPRVLKEARSLAQAGYKLTILAWDRQAEYPQNQMLAPNLEIQRIQSVRSEYGIGQGQVRPLLRFWQAIRLRLDQLQPDLVHCHDFDTLPVGYTWAKNHHVPAVYDAHEYYADLVRPRLHGNNGRLIYRLIRRAERHFSRRASAIITVDETLAEIYRALNSKVLVAGHYPSLDLVAAPTQVFAQPELNLLYVGRLSRDRGLNIYLATLERLRFAGIPARLTLAGVFTPAVEEIAFFEAAGALSRHIAVAGWINYERIPEILCLGDVGLSLLQPEPRYVAALPVKLFEYMAAGLPVLASDFPATRQVVQSCNCGALLDPSDPGKAAEVIAGWYAHPETARLLGGNGRRAVLEQYNWEALSAGIIRLYQSLL